MSDLETNVIKNTEREKPPFLYHASSNRNLEELRPAQKSWRDKKEGPVVFATQDKKYVSCFLTPTTDSWTMKSIHRIDDNPPIYIHCIADEKRFREVDKGGAIYKVSSENFDLDLSKSDKEWTSTKPVKVMDKEEYESSLEAMIENGVRVYFSNQEQLEEIKANNRGGEYEKSLQILDEIRSVNEERGLTGSINDILNGRGNRT